MNRQTFGEVEPHTLAVEIPWVAPEDAPKSSGIKGLAPATSPDPARLLICGDQTLYRSAIRSLIEARREFTVVDECTTEANDVQRALAVPVDMVLIDIDLTCTSDRDVAALEETLGRFAPRPVLILSAGLEPEACQAALRHGISGIVLKENTAEILFAALSNARRGQVWLDRPLLAQMFANSSHIRRSTCTEKNKIAQLTPREREIVEVACTGLTNKQIGERLFISEATVRHHLGSIFAKLGVSTRSELVAYGYRHNLTPRS